MKVLSVDDSTIIRKIIRGTADVLGYDFLEATNGQEALDLLNNGNEDVGLILLDWNMPVLDGFQTLQALKESPALKGIPVMMVTTEAEKENIIRAIKAGAKHYVVKPFTPEDLMIKIMECMGMA
ncbi:MAG: response regulator [Candidatus Melainabacteria bacterium]